LKQIQGCVQANVVGAKKLTRSVKNVLLSFPNPSSAIGNPANTAFAAHQSTRYTSIVTLFLGSSLRFGK
jgi:hypothetical protein